MVRINWRIPPKPRMTIWAVRERYHFAKLFDDVMFLFDYRTLAKVPVILDLDESLAASLYWVYQPTPHIAKRLVATFPRILDMEHKALP